MHKLYNIVITFKEGVMGFGMSLSSALRDAGVRVRGVREVMKAAARRILDLARNEYELIQGADGLFRGLQVFVFGFNPNDHPQARTTAVQRAENERRLDTIFVLALGYEGRTEWKIVVPEGAAIAAKHLVFSLRREELKASQVSPTKEEWKTMVNCEVTIKAARRWTIQYQGHGGLLLGSGSKLPDARVMEIIRKAISEPKASLITH